MKLTNHNGRASIDGRTERADPPARHTLFLGSLFRMNQQHPTYGLGRTRQGRCAPPVAAANTTPAGNDRFNTTEQNREVKPEGARDERPGGGREGAGGGEWPSAAAGDPFRGKGAPSRLLTRHRK